MPSYDYKCTECGHEVINFYKRIIEDHPTTCPECKKEGLQSLFKGAPQVQYKGDWVEASGKRGKF